MKREITKGILTGTTILYLLYIFMTGYGCATQQAQAPTVIVVCSENADQVRAQIDAIFAEEDQPFYEDFIDWFQRYGGAAVLGIFPFIIW